MIFASDFSGKFDKCNNNIKLELLIIVNIAFIGKCNFLWKLQLSRNDNLVKCKTLPSSQGLALN